MQTSVSLQILVPLAFVSLAPAAVINLTAGVARTDDPVTGVNDWTLVRVIWFRAQMESFSKQVGMIPDLD